MKRIGRLLASVSIVTASMTGAALAQTKLDPVATVQLAQQLASAAAGAEHGVVGAEAVTRSVSIAAQGVVINSAAEPRLVLAALDQVITTCRTAPPQSGWTCPSSEASFQALSSLRGIVIAQLELGDTAALDSRGFAAFGSIPTTSAGGASYIRP